MKNAVYSFIIISCFFLVSCRDAQKDQISKLYGYWKCEQEFSNMLTGSKFGYDTIAFTEKEMDYSKDRNILVIYEFKDGVVVIKEAGTDRIIATANFLDNNTVSIPNKDIMCVNGKFIRSNEAEFAQLRSEFGKVKSSSPTLEAGYPQTK
ncbi:hypothetical protein [Desulfobulbus oralis]|uniref:hypothetical protein n=1 Tax=Desulfobulbus oralis TaxID=1986146 RepID=UPI0011B05B44|nr:hypothetical protein [Desulfobulbus oralis]